MTLLIGAKLNRLCRVCGCGETHTSIFPALTCNWALLDVDTPTGVCTDCAEDYEYDQAMFVMAGREDQRVA